MTEDEKNNPNQSMEMYVPLVAFSREKRKKARAVVV